MLVCIKCGKTYDEEFRLRCDCGGTLLVKRNYKSFTPNSRFFDIRRYLQYLPVSPKYLPYLTPAVTPVVNASSDLYFKLDYLQPTGSFKDRGTYVTMAKLKEQGIREIVLDSSGNAAISMATYARIEGIKLHVFISYDSKPQKVSRLSALNVKIHFVDGDRMMVHEEAIRFANENDIAYVSHWLNPYFIEGTKTIAFEVYEQLGIPAHVFVPVGSGTAFLGLWKGFKELIEMGEIEEVPSLIAVQAEGFESLCERSKRINRLADGIAIPNPPRINEMRRALKESGGFCVSVGEEETLAASHWLKEHGFFVEETSATVLAAYWKAKERGDLWGSSLLILTGMAKDF
ncbi:threonine synthase [Pyrococcus sp. NA2]|uniref:pyridoxal-phosphate dependent enzyme n=1 Tax=Pyrococcus sp. (strain NA2) TaxID=342949 RepID=UPI000209AF56|nr:pyridoxal-phosphate dependent enzyme [Pyrococcus sp. NA2]AEC51131.1 threonine synthase [Pyrococcus sp. NA2]